MTQSHKNTSGKRQKAIYFFLFTLGALQASIACVVFLFACAFIASVLRTLFTALFKLISTKDRMGKRELFEMGSFQIPDIKLGVVVLMPCMLVISNKGPLTPMAQLDWHFGKAAFTTLLLYAQKPS